MPAVGELISTAMARAAIRPRASGVIKGLREKRARLSPLVLGEAHDEHIAVRGEWALV